MDDLSVIGDKKLALSPFYRQKCKEIFEEKGRNCAKFLMRKLKISESMANAILDEFEVQRNMYYRTK